MPAVHPLLRQFQPMLALTEAERTAVELVPLRREAVGADQPVLREGARPTRCCMVEAGLACSAKTMANGARQIIAFHVPGDMPDLASLHLEVRDSDVWALTDCDLLFVEHRDVRRLCDEHPRLAAVLWRVTLREAAVFREWVVNLGQRDGLARIAHLFCEVMRRMEAIGQAEGGTCAFPVTQDDLAEATGMSHVHVNRMLQELRRRKLLSFRRGRLTVHDWDALVAAADFREDYLHLRATGEA